VSASPTDASSEENVRLNAPFNSVQPPL
jgi:hypothetical protein